MSRLDVIASVGAALMHSAWIGAGLAGLVALALGFIPASHSRWRGRLAGAALGVLALLPLALASVGAASGAAWMRWVAVLWLAGAMAALVRLVNSLVAVRRLAVSARPLAAPWAELSAAWARSMGVDRVRVAESSDVEVPCTMGIRERVILLPEGLLHRLGPDEVRAVVAHELAHVARQDYLWHLAQVATEALVFYHPAAWWLSDVVDREREAACDRHAATLAPPASLARALAVVERTRRGDRPGGAPSQQPLRDRIAHLLGAEDVPYPALPGIAVAAVALVVLAGFAVASDASTPAPASSASWYVAAALGLAVGLRHAFEPDHLMAVATLVARDPGATSAARLGASWGIGHTVALLALGSSLALARRTLPDPLGEVFEVVVAVMITGMGVGALYEAWRAAGDGPRRWHAHGSRRHLHAAEGGHVHVGPLTLARGPLVVGLVHGVAGSGALTALAMSSLPTLGEQVGFMLVFGVGSTLGMAAVAAMAGWPLAWLMRVPQAARVLSAATGVAAIVFGVTWGLPLVRTILQH